MTQETMVKARARASCVPRPEIGAITEGRVYQIPAALFDDEIFERVEEEPEPAEGPFEAAAQTEEKTTKEEDA